MKRQTTWLLWMTLLLPGCFLCPERVRVVRVKPLNPKPPTMRSLVKRKVGQREYWLPRSRTLTREDVQDMIRLQGYTRQLEANGEPYVPPEDRRDGGSD